MAGNMRDAMPLCAAFIDAMRAEFGDDEINAQIRFGMQGARTFYACENGHEIGTPPLGWDDVADKKEPA